ncbi:adenosylcobinamide-GDP ribazoletransferase [Paracoccus sp. M683]|uniref:adenosylcobinamide-GDP ribazoletransferase n=1 Tax=Paracoccus sp. M683 TaxID=2594268 RepID=UPI00117FEF36|nr:adenosylcobinamide-GDP ribazoletransferase [Paracoccus sp. M683]TRW96196.1 adenosylcobinamide-GDP ribazoletransferase [Paracoccus sp. M683]
MRPADLWNQLVLALVFLTRLPLGFALPDREVPLMRSLWAFPLAGVVVGLIAGLPLWFSGPSLLMAALSVVLAIWLTGGLHEDGLADFTDGMGGQTRQERLRIMRDPAIGSYGTLALLGCLILRVVAIAGLGPMGPMALVAAAALGRALMVLTLAVLPAARQDGLGRAAGQAGRGQLLAAGAIALIVLAPMGQAGLAGLIAALVMAGLAIRLARQRLGGQTGDVLGTVAILAETAALSAMAIALYPATNSS